MAKDTDIEIVQHDKPAAVALVYVFFAQHMLHSGDGISKYIETVLEE